MEKENLNESGRSMVEMLGVLAIIGVLTIIGVAGFRYAMNKHYANQTVNRLMKRAVVVAAQANFGQTLSLHEFDENDGEYSILKTSLTHDAESFTLTVDNVPQEVCQQIVGLDWKLAKIIPADCSDTTMKFKFLNDLTDCSRCVADSVDCPPNSEMQCGKCSIVRGFADNDDDCEGNENGQYCVRGKCSQCQEGYALHALGQSKTCNACSKNGTTCYSTEDYKHHCLGTAFYTSDYNFLVGCEDTSRARIGNVDETSCKECEARCLHTSDNSCRLYGGETGFDRNSDGTCSDCKVGYFWYGLYFKECLPCQNGNVVWAYTAEYNKHHCIGSMIYSGDYNRMYGCEHSQDAISSADEESCKACTNRCYKDGTCYLAGEGQLHQRVSETDGTCQE